MGCLLGYFRSERLGPSDELALLPKTSHDCIHFRFCPWRGSTGIGRASGEDIEASTRQGARNPGVFSEAIAVYRRHAAAPIGRAPDALARRVRCVPDVASTLDVEPEIGTVAKHAGRDERSS
jgi:hypothetical protein